MPYKIFFCGLTLIAAKDKKEALYLSCSFYHTQINGQFTVVSFKNVIFMHDM